VNLESSKIALLVVLLNVRKKETQANINNARAKSKSLDALS